MKVSLPLVKNVIKPLEESVLTPLELTAATSAADVGTHQKVLGSVTTTLILSKEEARDILKIVKAPLKSLED